jgi:hypothetical protein
MTSGVLTKLDRMFIHMVIGSEEFETLLSPLLRYSVNVCLALRFKF